MLVVDDERDICDCLERFFCGRGFVVSCAFSGEEALEQLHQESVDVLLLDLLLPGLSGIEVLRRAKILRPALQVIVVTAFDRAELRVAASRYGASGYVTKPFDFSETTWSLIL